MSPALRYSGCLILAACLLAEPLKASGGVIVAGADRVRGLPPAGASVLSYENSGYRLRLVGGEVQIIVDTDSLNSTSRFNPVPMPDPHDRLTRLARTLTLGSDTQYAATSRILSWVARSIAYDADRAQPQDALAVLSRRRGYCTGISRLTVALLQAAGLQAREVAGYILDDDDELGGGYHRWIEVFLPDRGWIFSDPLRSHHYVPATYVRLASEALRTADGLKGLLLERRSTLTAVDLLPTGVPGVTARRNSDRRHAAALSIRLEGGREGTIELSGRSLRRTRPITADWATFVGLEPGHYTLRLDLPHGTVERTLEIRDRARRAISFPAILGRRHQSTLADFPRRKSHSAGLKDPLSRPPKGVNE